MHSRTTATAQSRGKWCIAISEQHRVTDKTNKWVRNGYAQRPSHATNKSERLQLLPACLSMVLAYQGVTVGEQELCDLLDTQLIGTEVWNVLLLEQHIANGHVEIDSMSFDRLRESLSANIPPIAFVATRHLSHWQHETIHAVVVVGISENSIHVNVNDPALSDAPCAVPRAEFLAAWSELDFLTVIVAVKP